MALQKLPVFFISHGGGPWPWMDDMKANFQKTGIELKKLGALYRPKAILVISGHWEETEFSVSTSKFLSPAYFTLAAGLEYRRGSDISLFLSPLAARVTLAGVRKGYPCALNRRAIRRWPAGCYLFRVCGSPVGYFI